MHRKRNDQVTLADVGRLEHRVRMLCERIAAQGGPNADTTSDESELASLEAAIAALDAIRWRKSIDEPIPENLQEIAAATVDDSEALLLLRRSGGGWQCTCGCGRMIVSDRIIRWRPTSDAAMAGREHEDDEKQIIGLTSYRGRQRLAVLDDRVRYLGARMKELKEKGSRARYEKDELEALTWIVELAKRSGRSGNQGPES